MCSKLSWAAPLAPHRASVRGGDPALSRPTDRAFKAGRDYNTICPDGPVKMLVQVALLVFAFCGLLGLVVDVGYMRLTQSQMQTAADAAALEGLRKRDVG